VRIVRVTDQAGVVTVVDVHDRVFGSDHSGSARHWRRGCARRRTRWTSCSRWRPAHRCPAAGIESSPGTDFAGLWSGGTLPPWRGREIYRALVGFRVRSAAERASGSSGWTHSRRAGRAMAGMGFTQLTTTVEFTKPARDRAR